jgi:hypothetical protein
MYSMTKCSLDLEWHSKTGYCEDRKVNRDSQIADLHILKFVKYNNVLLGESELQTFLYT